MREAMKAMEPYIEMEYGNAKWENEVFKGKTAKQIEDMDANIYRGKSRAMKAHYAGVLKQWDQTMKECVQ
jgi:hypothetical protein